MLHFIVKLTDSSNVVLPYKKAIKKRRIEEELVQFSNLPDMHTKFHTKKVPPAVSEEFGNKYRETRILHIMLFPVYQNQS